jgi:PiT family inorganic phosphate transporter
MSEAALPGSIEPAVRREPDLTGALNPITAILVGAVVASVPLSVAYSTYFDIAANGEKVKRCAPFLLRFVGLLVTLGFEFVSALHDVANEVASATYTGSLPAGFAVVWSGSYDLPGAWVSSGAVAVGLVSLLPAELVLRVGTPAFGFPASSWSFREERPTHCRRPLRSRRERSAKWLADLER